MKVKYNVKGVDSSKGDFTPVKPGMYRAKVIEINEWSGQYGAGMEVVLEVTQDQTGGTDFEGKGSRLWTYIYFDHEPTAPQLRQFLEAVEVVKDGKEQGELDTDKIVKKGVGVQVRVKSGQNQDGDYRPKVGRLLPLSGEEPAGEPDEPDEPDAEPDEPEAEPEGDEGAIDLDALDRDELKKLIKAEGLGSLADLGINTATTDDQIRAIIVEKMSPPPEDEPEPEAEPEPEDEPEAEPDEPEAEPEPDEPEPEPGPDLDSMDRAELKQLIKDQGLEITVYKTWDDDKVRAEIKAVLPAAGAGGSAGKPDYTTWNNQQLKDELKERGLPMTGNMQDKVKRLQDDDKSDRDPF